MIPLFILIGIILFFIEKFIINNLYYTSYENKWKNDYKTYDLEEKVTFPRIFYICMFFMFTLPFVALFIFIPSVTMILVGAFSTRDFYFSERLTKNWLFRYLGKKV